MPFKNWILNIRNLIQNVSHEEEEEYFKNFIIDKIQLGLKMDNGLEYIQSEVARLDGGSNVLVIIVGANGSINGFENKYFRIAKRANTIYNSTVFIFANNLSNWRDPKIFFSEIMKYVNENVVNKTELNIKLFGYSAGASLASYYAYEYQQIKKLLLVNPPLTDTFDLTIKGIKLFTGNTTLVVGKGDPDIKMAELFTQNEYANIFDKVILFDGADHNFKGLLEEFINLPFEYLYDRISLTV